MNNLADPMLLLPEIALCGLIVLLFVLDLLMKGESRKHLGTVCAAGMGVTLAIAFLARGLGGATLNGAYANDPMAVFFKCFFLLCALFVAVMSREYVARFDRGIGEFYILISLATLGMVTISAVTNLLVLFVALELITLSFYVLTAYHYRQERSLEAGTKYLVLGALSSAVLLYGISFVYGATGSVDFSAIAQALKSGDVSALAVLGMVLIVAGIGFKIACVPFQLWVPDVYQGAPTPVTAFLSVGSKAAGFVILLRLLLGVFGSLQNQWVLVISALSAMTILYGNLGAILQTNMKRLLGYSSIGHAGYLLMGIAAGSPLGAGAVIFYLTAYLFTNLAAFLVLIVVARTVEGEEISQWNGLAQRSPFLAAAMFLALLSLAGVPPLAGFTGKFLLFTAAVNSGLIWLAVIGALNVVVSLYYYLMIINAMYFKAAQTDAPLPINRMTRAALVACIAGMVGLGFLGEPFVQAAMAAIKPLF